MLKTRKGREEHYVEKFQYTDDRVDKVGAWAASIASWREEFGRDLMGTGYIPCPDYRMTVDAKWDNVRYYCDKMKELSL